MAAFRKKKRKGGPVTYRTPAEALESAGRIIYWDEERAQEILFAVIRHVVKEPESEPQEAPQNQAKKNSFLSRSINRG